MLEELFMLGVSHIKQGNNTNGMLFCTHTVGSQQRFMEP